MGFGKSTGSYMKKIFHLQDHAKADIQAEPSFSFTLYIDRYGIS